MRFFRYRGGGARYKTRLPYIALLDYDRHTMRWAKSYSIIDHEILHGGYLHRLSHEAMILYLFLVVVGDREGRSFYADATIMEILRLSNRQLTNARMQLTKEGLIDYRRPYWFVKTIQGGKSNGRGKTQDTVSAGCHAPEFSADRRYDRDFAKACIKDISRMLSGEGK